MPQKTGEHQPAPGRYPFVVIESLLVVTLSAIPVMLYYTTRLKNLYDYSSIFLLVLWLIALRGRTQRRLPLFVVLSFAFYTASFLISAMVSEFKPYVFPELNCLRIPLLAGLIYIMPFNLRNRKIIITAYLTVAATIGIVGTLQYFGIYFPRMDRPVGIINMPGIYAGMLSFACGTSALMLFIRRHREKTATVYRVFNAFIFICCALGILVYQSRGVWIAFFPALVITMFLHDRRRTTLFALVSILIVATVFVMSGRLRERATSTLTSLYTENASGSTGNRLELWKASILIFSRSPLFGTGLWDFQNDVDALVREGKIQNMPVTFHAHNLYLHNLATRGIVGLIATITLLAFLIRMGLSLVRKQGGIGGYVIIFSCVFILLTGLTETSFADGSPYAYIFWYTIGLIGTVNNETGSEGHTKQESIR